jgi:hypothetical protein
LQLEAICHSFLSATNEEVFYYNFSIQSLKLLLLAIIKKKVIFFTHKVCQKRMSIFDCNKKKIHPYGVIPKIIDYLEINYLKFELSENFSNFWRKILKIDIFACVVLQKKKKNRNRLLTCTNSS